MKYGAKKTGTADSMERKAKTSRSAYMKALEDAQKKDAKRKKQSTMKVKKK